MTYEYKCELVDGFSTWRLSCHKKIEIVNSFRLRYLKKNRLLS